MRPTGLETLLKKTAGLSPAAAGALGGAALYGGVGAGLGALSTPEGESRWQGALYGGLSSAPFGALHGLSRGIHKERIRNQAYEASRPPPDPQAYAREQAAWESARARQRAYYSSPFGDDPSAGSSRSTSARPSSVADSAIHEVAPFLQGATSKADAKARFRAAARQQHPDLGGSTESMQELNDQWDKAQAHPAYAKFASVYAQGCRNAARVFGV